MRDSCMVHVHERGHSSGDQAMNLAVKYAKWIVERLENNLTEMITAEVTNRGVSEEEIKSLISQNAQIHENDMTDIRAEVVKNSGRIEANTEEIGTVKGMAQQVSDSLDFSKAELETKIYNNTAAIANVENRIDKIENANVYSQEPVQIGTWIDGTPIWRYAFDITTELPRGDNYTLPLPIIDYNQFFYTVSPYIKAKIQKPCAIDDHPLILVSPNAVEIPSALYEGYDGLYGYVEFVTPESNIGE